MSLITNRTRSNNVAGNTKTNDKVGEYDHLATTYINVYMEQEVEQEDGSTVVNRIKVPLGIDMSRLRDRGVYASQSPEMQQQTELLNTMLAELRETAENMEEGQTIDLALGVEIYKRQEAIENSRTSSDVKNAVKSALFK